MCMKMSIKMICVGYVDRGPLRHTMQVRVCHYINSYYNYIIASTVVSWASAHALPGKHPCSSFQGVNVAGSI